VRRQSPPRRLTDTVLIASAALALAAFLIFLIWAGVTWQ
jgi:hypothetical protein